MPDQLQLAVTGAPLAPDFRGTPQEYYEQILTNMRVIFPTGQTTFVISDTEPSTNLGPWLKNGSQWYVWDDATKRYVPQDISPSLKLVVISETAPADGTKPLWLQIKGTRVVRWNAWIGDAWRPLTNRGTTAQRPTDPVEYEHYEDTTIGAEIVFYSGEWHTVSGVPGDIKFVAFTTLADALAANPGWTEIGQYYSLASVRGRVFVPAHKDPGVSPVAMFDPAVGITARAVNDKYGEEAHILTAAETVNAPHQHLVGRRKDAGSNDLQLQFIDSRSFSSALTGTGKFEVLGEGVGAGTAAGNLANGDLVSSDPIQVGTRSRMIHTIRSSPRWRCGA
jgi:hypothetical protein